MAFSFSVRAQMSDDAVVSYVREGVEYILTSCDKVNFILQRVL